MYGRQQFISHNCPVKIIKGMDFFLTVMVGGHYVDLSPFSSVNNLSISRIVMYDSFT